MSPDDSTGSVADLVTVSYPDDDWVRDELETEAYTTYLRRARGDRVEVGEEWDEFVDTGCGSRRDVVLRVEGVDGGESIGADTAIEFVPRETA